MGHLFSPESDPPRRPPVPQTDSQHTATDRASVKSILLELLYSILAEMESGNGG